MAQTYQMKHNPQGTIYSLLTVESDGQMTMTFHGTDREICHEANVTEDGRITTGGSLFPGLESGRWQLMDDVVETTNYTNNYAEPEAIEETTDCTDCTFERPRQSGKRLTPRGKKITTTDNTDCTDIVEVSETTTDNTDLTDVEPVVVETNTNCTNYTNNEPLTIDRPRPRRQRKPRKPRVERQTSAISHQTPDIDHQTSSTLKAVGMVAAATVALFVIYETGLLIPLGLIGLATGGILK